MASVSLSLTADLVSVEVPYNISVGAAAPGTGDVEIRVNTANVTTLKDIYLALERFARLLQDENLGPATFGLL